MNQTRITAGGDQLEFQSNTSTETAGLEAAKIVFNNGIGTPAAKSMTINISNIHLNIPLQEYQYMSFNINMVPQEVIDLYNLQNKVLYLSSKIIFLALSASTGKTVGNRHLQTFPSNFVFELKFIEVKRSFVTNNFITHVKYK